MRTGLAKIYLVDDDASIRRALGRVMASAGFEHEAFASAEDFLAKADGAGAVCVVADARLSGMSGLELIRLAAPTFPDLPFILLTANDEEETRREARAAGAAAFFRKPVDAEALLDPIRWAIRPPSPARVPAG